MTLRQEARAMWLELSPGLRFVLGMALAILAIVAFGSLAGCGATLPVVPARTAIPVACKEPIPQRPAMPMDNLAPDACDGDKACLDQFTAAAIAERQRRDGYEDQLVTALQVCTSPVNQPPRSTP